LVFTHQAYKLETFVDATVAAAKAETLDAAENWRGPEQGIEMCSLVSGLEPWCFAASIVAYAPLLSTSPLHAE
jgi:hypothetical protein